MNAQTAERTALIETPTAPRSNVVPYRPEPAQKAYPPKIAKALLAVTREIGAIGKTGWNDFHKYHYQKWEDVLERLSILLPQHGLIVMQSEVARSLFENDQMMAITYDFTIINEDGDAWPERPVWTAIARARDSKGTPDDKAANKAHTQAHKYFLLHTFKIRTKDTAEDDSDGDGTATQKTASPPKPPKPGSAEAKALDGPRAIAADTAEAWIDSFMEATKGATVEQFAEWQRLNAKVIERLKTAYPDLHKKIEAVADSSVSTTQAAPPKPPRPQASAAPAKLMMPADPEQEPESFIAFLKAKLADFADIETGSAWWSDVIDPIGLRATLYDDAMAEWSAFERRFET